MIQKLLAITGGALLATTSSHAALSQWQSAVGEGTVAASTHFATVTEPTLVDVGTLSGDRSFEFIVRADISTYTASAALLGTFTSGAASRQALKTKQWEGAENAAAHIGATAFGVLDHLSPVAFPSNADTHIVFTTNGTDTTVYLNGAAVHTFSGLAITLSGVQGLGGAINDPVAGTWIDASVGGAINGSISGFASYDSALSPTEISTHYAAFLAPVPEPGSIGLAALAGLALVARRSRRVA